MLYANKYKNEFQSLSLVYDDNMDGEVDEDEEDTKIGEIRWNR